MYVHNQINVIEINKNVMALFNIKWKYHIDLSVRKLYSYYKDMDEHIKTKLECIQRAHHQLLHQYIFVGYKF
jgi:hypothetical protein